MCIGDTVTAWSILQNDSLSLFFSIVFCMFFLAHTYCVIAYSFVVQDVYIGVDFDVIVVGCFFEEVI